MANFLTSLTFSIFLAKSIVFCGSGFLISRCSALLSVELSLLGVSGVLSPRQ